MLDSDGARVQEYQHDHKPEPGRGLRKYYLKYLKMLLENIILRVVEEDEYNQNQEILFWGWDQGSHMMVVRIYGNTEQNHFL